MSDEERRIDQIVQALGLTIDGFVDTLRLVETCANSPAADKKRVAKLRARAAGLLARAYHNLLRAEIERAMSEIQASVADGPVAGIGG